MKRGHVPTRQCIGCRRRRPKAELIRLKACGEAAMVSPAKDRAAGRGCYVCPRQECVEASLGKGRLARALGQSISVLPSKDELMYWAREKGVIE